jgi:hypothetical protein
MTRAKASSRTVRPSGSSGIGSPKTIGPAAIVKMLAVALVAVMTGTTGPICSERAETSRPTSDSTRITSASGWRTTRRPRSVWSDRALIATSEPPHSRPAETARKMPSRGRARASGMSSRPATVARPT